MKKFFMLTIACAFAFYGNCQENTEVSETQSTESENADGYQVSDKNAKKKIKKLDYGLKEVLEMKPVQYTFKDESEEKIGFIAQDMQELVPEVIRQGEVNLEMNYAELTSVLVKALQEMYEQNEALEKRVHKLEAQKREMQDYRELIQRIHKLEKLLTMSVQSRSNLYSGQ